MKHTTSDSYQLPKPLACKPGFGVPPDVYFKKNCHAINQTISIRSLDMDKDLYTIHEWVNLPYAAAYWQMRGSYELLRTCYQCIMGHPWAHSFAVLLGEELIAQIEVYSLHADELGQLVPHEIGDAGFHLLMAPPGAREKGITSKVIQTFLQFYFSFETAGTLWGEPDHQNTRSIRLLQEAGFHFVKTVQLSYKKAYAYQLQREQFLSY